MSVDRLSYRTLQWLVAVLAVLHNLEEALTIPSYAPEVRHRLSQVLPSTVLAATEDLSWFYVALSVYFLRRSVRDGALSRGQALLAMALAVPVLVVGLGTLYLGVEAIEA